MFLLFKLNNVRTIRIWGNQLWEITVNGLFIVIYHMNKNNNRIL